MEQAVGDSTGDPRSLGDQTPTGRLRRPTLVSGPVLVLALMAAVLTLWLILWGLWYSDGADSGSRATTEMTESALGGAFWIPLVLSALVTVGGFVMTRGCFIDVTDTTVRDVIFWVTLRRFTREEIRTVRVRPGFWRFFEVVLDDGTTKVLLGACPSQFPARLLPSAAAQDLADMELILGE